MWMRQRALASNQRFNLATAAKTANATGNPDALLSFVTTQLASAPLAASVTGELGAYLRATGTWTGGDTQIQQKMAGLVHLVAGSPEYQFT